MEMDIPRVLAAQKARNALIETLADKEWLKTGVVHVQWEDDGPKYLIYLLVDVEYMNEARKLVPLYVNATGDDGKKYRFPVFVVDKLRLPSPHCP